MTYIVCFAGIHVVFMLKLVVAAHDCGIFAPDDVLHALHELAEDFKAGLWRQDKRSCSVVGVRSDRLTECHWADALDRHGLVELHGGQVGVLGKDEQCPPNRKKTIAGCGTRLAFESCMAWNSPAFDFISSHSPGR